MDTSIHHDSELLVIKNLSKSFPGVKALDRINFSLGHGEVHALLGENGAGKSTLIKILSGAYPKDTGEFFIDGKAVDISNPKIAQKLGISTIYQEFNLASHLSVAENIYLGHLPHNGGIVARKKLLYKAKSILESLGAEIDPETMCGSLSIAEQQIVEIAKALSHDARILIMDEPSAVIGDDDLERLFKIIIDLKSRGVSIIYISHRIKEIFQIASKVTVMKDGLYIGTYQTDSISQNELIAKMVGRKIESIFPKYEPYVGQENILLDVNMLAGKEYIHDANFKLKAGEILGVAGLIGSGRTELMRLIFGADAIGGGEIKIQGERFSPKNPRHAINKGIGLVPENRKQQGLFLQQSVLFNITIPSLLLFSRFLILLLKSELKTVKTMINNLRIKTPSHLFAVVNMSGGNQQKAILARWLCRDTKILILDEPTRGIDVGSKSEIYQLINELKQQGKGIILISSELPEVLGMSDNILIMHQGRIMKEISRDIATEEVVMAYAFGHSPE